jgi:uncharacterized membrane protein (DUF485 family)
MECKTTADYMKYCVGLWLMLLIFFTGMVSFPLYFMSGRWSLAIVLGILFGTGVIAVSYVLVNYDNYFGYADLW